MHTELSSFYAMWVGIHSIFDVWKIGDTYLNMLVVGLKLREFVNLGFDKMGKKDKNYWSKQVARKLWTVVVFRNKMVVWWAIWWLFDRESTWIR